MIQVINYHHGTHTKPGERCINIMRPHPLSNPYNMAHMTREQCIEKYRVFLWDPITRKTSIYEQLLAILELDHDTNEHIFLSCCCKPKPCHGDVIINALTWLKSQMPTYQSNLPAMRQIHKIRQERGEINMTQHGRQYYLDVQKKPEDITLNPLWRIKQLRKPKTKLDRRTLVYGPPAKSGRNPEMQQYFEGAELYKHQAEVFGDISENVKIQYMLDSEQDRYRTFKDAGKILQERHTHITPTYETHEIIMHELRCTAPQATRLIETMKALQLDHKTKHYLVDYLIDARRSDQFVIFSYPEPFINLEGWIRYLADLASELAKLDTHHEDALNFHEPYHEEQDPTCYHDPISADSPTEEDLIELNFADDVTSSLDTHAYRTVYDEGSGPPFLTDREYDRLLTATRTADKTQLSKIGQYLFHTSQLTWIQSQDYWPIYRRRKADLLAASKQAYSILSTSLRYKLSLVRLPAQLRFIGAWLHATLNGTKFNGEDPDPQYRYLDNRARSWLWNTYNNARNLREIGY